MSNETTARQLHPQILARLDPRPVSKAKVAIAARFRYVSVRVVRDLRAHLEKTMCVLPSMYFTVR